MKNGNGKAPRVLPSVDKQREALVLGLHGLLGQIDKVGVLVPYVHCLDITEQAVAEAGCLPFTVVIAIGQPHTDLVRDAVSKLGPRLLGKQEPEGPTGVQ